MRRAVGADDASAIDREHHRQILQHDVVDHLIVRPLQERRIDRHHRLHAFARESCRERDGVLLRDTDVEVALGERLRKAHESRALAHRRGDADQAQIRGRHVAQPVAEHLRVGRLGGGLRNDPDGWIELGHGVIENRILLGARVAVALARHDVQELRPL